MTPVSPALAVVESIIKTPAIKSLFIVYPYRLVRFRAPLPNERQLARGPLSDRLRIRVAAAAWRAAIGSSSFRWPSGEASALAYHGRDDIDRLGNELLDGVSRDRGLNPVALAIAGALLVAAYAAPYLLQPIEGDLARD